MLFKPNITLVNSVNGVSEGQQQGLEVMEGYNFTISCSIRPQYPGGYFHLTFTGPNTTHTYIQPAVNHSHTLLFPEVDLTESNTTFNHSESNTTFNFTESYGTLNHTDSNTTNNPTESYTTNNPTSSYTTHQQYEERVEADGLLGETEHQQHEEVDLQGDAEAAGSGRGPPKDEVDPTDLTESNTTLNFTESNTTLNFTESNGTFNPTESNGTFNLTEFNTTRDHAQPDVNRSENFLFANFRFPAANHSHQGNYSCTYHLYVFNHNFSSKSEVLSLTVKGVCFSNHDMKLCCFLHNINYSCCSYL